MWERGAPIKLAESVKRIENANISPFTVATDTFICHQPHMDDTVLVAALSTLGVVLLTVLLYLYRQRQTPPPAPSVRAIDPSVKKSKKSKKSKAKEGTSKPTPSAAPTKKGTKPKKSKESSQQPSSVPTAEAQPTPDVTDVLFENYYYDSSFEQFDPMTENGNTEHTVSDSLFSVIKRPGIDNLADEYSR